MQEAEVSIELQVAETTEDLSVCIEVVIQLLSCTSMLQVSEN